MSTPAVYAQSVETSTVVPSVTAVPNVIRFSGTLTDGRGYPITTPIDATFSLYSEPLNKDSKSPLWQEKQRITPNDKGVYTVYLGGATAKGLPAEIFTSVTAQYVGVKLDGEAELARVPLVSVPYALKASDAQTLGGLPASAFVLAGSQVGALVTGASASTVTPDVSGVTTNGGTSDYLPKFTGTSTVANSQIYDNGTNVGIGDTPSSSVKLDVGGAMIIRGNTIVARTGNATASKGYPSSEFAFYANAYNSSTHLTDNPHFQMQSEPVGNDSASTSATFNLLYANGGTPVETGFFVNPNGTINFAPSQTFPGGTGTGTITGVTAGTDLTGGGTKGAVTLNLNLGATDARYAQLAAANTFTADNTFTGRIVGLSVEDSAGDAAVLGQSVGPSSTYNFLHTSSLIVGVWGDAANAPSNTAPVPLAIAGTADQGYAAIFENNSANLSTIIAFNFGNGPTGLFKTAILGGPTGTCGVGGNGDLSCTGQIKSLVSTDSGEHTVETYAMQSPENWMEDFGTGELQGGSGVVKIDPVFAGTVSGSTDYHVFLTPRGDSRGLYVTNPTASTFEVHESGGGTASISFDYRIVAKRRGYEAQRLTDVTEAFKSAMKAGKALTRAPLKK